MNAAQFRKAWQIAKDSNVDLTNVNFDNLSGFGLSEFAPQITTVEAVAKTIRWQCAIMDGSWDMAELNEIKRIGKKKFIIVD